jgi:hypothetical protein
MARENVLHKGQYGIYTYLTNSKILKLFIMQFFQPPVTFCLLGSDVHLLSFRLRNQVSHQYRTTKIKDVPF